MIYTFDVFDTLITRKTYSPHGIFYIVQEKLKKNNYKVSSGVNLQESFVKMRINAEREANRVINYTKKDCNLPDFDEIYRAFSVLYSVTDKECEYLRKLEFEAEKANILPIKENIDMLKKLIEEGEDVVLISDMYMSEKEIRELLLSVDNIFDNISLLVSSAYRKTKSKGDLYSFFIDKYNVKDGWIHIGDNISSDVNMARRMGAVANYYNKSIISSELLDYPVSQKNVTTELVKGTSKYLLDDKNSEAFNIGVAISGPILFGYVKWIIDVAEKQGIEDLYFWARDGYLLQKIANIITEAYEYNIQSHYIYGSRQTLYMPSVVASKHELIEYMNSKLSYTSYEKILSGLGISYEELIKNSNINFDYSDIKKVFTELEGKIIKQNILRDGKLIDYLMLKWGEQRAYAINYLSQEIDFSKKYAFVDLQGTGYSQVCLQKILSDCCNNPDVVTFYFSLYPRDDYHDTNNRFLNYMQYEPKIAGVIEAISRAPHAQTVAYTKDNQKVVPLFSEGGKDYLDAETFNEYEKGILSFCGDIVSQEFISSYELAELIESILKFICDGKSEIATKFIGEMPFEKECETGIIRKFGPRIHLEDIIKIYENGIPNLEYYKGASLDFSSLMFSANENKIIRKLQEKATSRFNEKNSANSSRLIAGKYVIYGAGIVGNRVYKEIIGNSKCQVVGWVDKNYQLIQSENNIVRGLDILKDLDFDFIIIAIKNPTVCNEVAKELVAIGINEDKII